MYVLKTDRLLLRNLTPDDDTFILRLLNEPSYIRYIGDKGVRTIEDARQYLLDKLIDSYEQFGFGLYLVELKSSAMPIGICGLVNREWLEDVDVGFAFLPQFWSKGYAYESAAAVMAYGRDTLGLTRIVAITSPDNDPSIRLLEKLGLNFDRMIEYPDDGSKVKLFVSDV